MKINWNYPTTIWLGEKRIQDLSLACKNLKIDKPLFVTDKDLINLKMVQDIIFDLKKRFNQTQVFSNFAGNPVGENVEEGVDQFKKLGCDGVIAFGGGSGLDVGKAIAFMSGQSRPIWDFEDSGDYWKRANETNIAPIIAIPTTAGTGSETGRASVFTNELTEEKKIIFHPKMLPSVVILDPDLTIPLPPSLTAFTGMDALAHCLEAYSSNNFHPLSQGIALEGMKMIKDNLILAYKDGKNINARANMLATSSMGSIAFQKGLGGIHSLSHPIGAIYNTHHGLTNAVFMPYVIVYNKEAIEDKIIQLARYLNIPQPSFDSFLNWIIELRKSLSIPHTLKELIDNKNNFEKMSEMAYRDPSTSTNPITLNRDDFLKLYNDAYDGLL